MQELSNEDKLFLSPMRKNDREKILFLCIGNTCRSIIASSIFASKYSGYDIYSAGVRVKKDTISKETETVLEVNGLEPIKTKPTDLSEIKHIRFDRTIILDSDIFEEGLLKTNFYHIASIEDPEGKDLDFYQKTFKEIEEYIDSIKAFSNK